MLMTNTKQNTIKSPFVSFVPEITQRDVPKKIMSYTIKSNKHMNVYNADPGM